MDLDIDAGNTRIKWRLRDRGQVAARGVADDLAALGVAVELPAAGIDRMRVASVRDQEFELALCAHARQHWHCEAEFARVEARCAGVTNAYTDPSRMGVDRWLAMLAAYNLVQRSCCIVDCGSAITVDALQADGRHAGGFIVPGLSMQRRMLAGSTGRIRLSSQPDWTGLTPGTDTETAVSHGVLSMVVSWLAADRFVSSASASESLFVVGGDVEVLAPWLRERGLIWSEPGDLVLDGLQYSVP